MTDYATALEHWQTLDTNKQAAYLEAADDYDAKPDDRLAIAMELAYEEHEMYLSVSAAIESLADLRDTLNRMDLEAMHWWGESRAIVSATGGAADTLACLLDELAGEDEADQEHEQEALDRAVEMNEAVDTSTPH